MLLRRMMEHVTDQNWFAVGLDFFIVVSGVALAFQLTSWAQDRAADERAEQSLFHLYEESEAAAAYAIEDVDEFNGWLANQDMAIAALSAGSLDGVTPEELEAGLITQLFYPAVSPPRRIYDELSSSGLLREIDAPEAMAAVGDYYEAVDFIEGQLSFFRAGTAFARHRLHDGINSIYDPTAPSRRRVEIDFESLAADQQFISNRVSQLRNQRQFQNYRRDMMVEAVHMCRALASAVGRTCQAGLDLTDEELRSPTRFRDNEEAN